MLSGCDSGEDTWATYQRQHNWEGGSPSVSPDGQCIAYSSPSSGRGDIYRVSRKGLTRLTQSDEFEAQPLYSPSGDKIAYVRESGGWRHVWIMNADGSNQTQLTAGRVLDDLVGFSSDGKDLYFIRATPSTGLGRDGVCYVVDLGGRNLRPQPPETCPPRPNEFASADGTRIIAFGPYSSSAVRVLTSGTRDQVETLDIPDGEISRPALSYDGNVISFTLLEPEANDVAVYLVRRDRLVPQRVK
jgi:dipeptidyl aminopeptidase/acylaminoacyl peptidase